MGLAGRVVAFALLVSTPAFAVVPLAIPTTRTVYVPTSASIHGNAGTFFHTDLWALNRSFTSSLSVTAIYHCFAGTCAASVKSFTLAPRESRLFSDVDASLFLLPETAGAIEMTFSGVSDDLLVTTRTYSPSLPAPTSGTAIPGASIADARSRAVFLGLGSNAGDLSSGFRTNAGAFFPSGTAPVTVVTYTLYRADGTLLGSTSQTLSSGTAGQINDVFTVAGAGATSTTNAYLVLTSFVPVLPFVTVIDNQSGDSVFVPASEDLPAAPTELIKNGTFDAGISFFGNLTPTYITLSSASADGHGSPSSGSLLVSNTRPTTGGGSGATQCVPVAGGDLLNLGGRVFIPSSGSGKAQIQLYFYPAAGCGGTLSEAGRCSTNLTGEVDRWVTLSGSCSAPSGSLSAIAIAFTENLQASGAFLAYFDDISINRSAR